MYDGLSTNCHLRHDARLQLIFYLKGIGLPFEGTRDLFRHFFTKKISKEEFEKNYLYNIRHAYGMVGRRVSYSSFSCGKILKSPMPDNL